MKNKANEKREIFRYFTSLKLYKSKISCLCSFTHDQIAEEPRLLIMFLIDYSNKTPFYLTVNIQIECSFKINIINFKSDPKLLTF